MFKLIVLTLIGAIQSASIANGSICDINVDTCSTPLSCCQTVSGTSNGPAASNSKLVCVPSGSQKG